MAAAVPGGLAAALAGGLAAALAGGLAAVFLAAVFLAAVFLAAVVAGGLAAVFLAAVFLAGGLGINKPHVFSIFLNKLFPHLNVIAHKGRKNLVGNGRVGRGYLQKRAAG